jgi:MFS transporter, SHS family, lactate transporter
MSQALADAPARAAAEPWYRQVTPAQWKAFGGSYLAWVLDGFDYTILQFLLVDIQRSFTVNKALAGALLTVTLVCRAIGGTGAGAAADRWGRKLPLMLSILWYSIFAFLSGFSSSYGMLFGLRALFGIGMGGVWAAGMPLTLEHWPAHLRGTASGLMQSGYSVGFLLSSIVFEFGYPAISRHTAYGWRAMLWLGVLPAVVVLFIMRSVEESPVWLARQRHLREQHARDPVSLGRLFTRDLLPTTVHTSMVMAAYMFMYHSITAWYPTLLTQLHRPALPFLAALNIGGIAGSIVCGRMSEGGLGRRGAATIATLTGLAVIPMYVLADRGAILLAGAAAMGLFGAGNFGIVPGYLTERFPTVARAVGAGFAYHVGAGLGSFTPTLVGALQDRGLPLPTAMAACISASGLLVVALLWMGPETRGTEFRATG